MSADDMCDSPASATGALQPDQRAGDGDVDYWWFVDIRDNY